MRKTAFPLLFSLLLLFSVLLSAMPGAVASPRVIHVPGDYPTIWWAINVASPGDTIFVEAGTYVEPAIFVNKPGLRLIGAGSNVTTIDGGGASYVLVISANNVYLSGFTLRNSAYLGIYQDGTIGEATLKQMQALRKAIREPQFDTTNPVANAGPDQMVKVGATVNFNASGSTDNVGIASYEWDFGDGNNGTGLTTNHTYTEQGTYTVTLTVKDAAGNSATDSLTVTVEAAPAFPWWIVAIIGIVIVAAVALALWKRS